MRRVTIYDTTLRDGTQAEHINLTTEDKLRISLKLDELGVAYIEGGWPGSNPTDKRFFQEIRNYDLKTARIAAFGSTHNHRATAATDANLKALLDSGAPVLTIFGKCWDIHVTEALGTTLERNLELVADSLGVLRPGAEELFFDAEHFFDGFKANPDYALAVLRKAAEAGADVLVLCDTNGGTLPRDFRRIMEATVAALPGCVSESIRTTTRAWPWPMSSKALISAPSRSRALSTAMASVAATPTCAPSSRPWSSRWAFPACPRAGWRRSPPWPTSSRRRSTRRRVPTSPTWATAPLPTRPASM
jgi:hypothetical protein